MRHYLITGLSGTGKTVVGKELMEAGYFVIQADDCLVKPSVNSLVWLWDRALLENLLHTHPVAFVCGGADNQDEFLLLFQKIFILTAPLEVCKQRLANRGTHVDGWKRGIGDDWERRKQLYAGAKEIDASKPLRKVVYDILRSLG